MKINNKIFCKKSAITLIEVVIAAGLFSLLMLAAYRLFFAEIRSISTALSHIGVNENARRFFAHFGNDIRNANWVEYPDKLTREVVDVLMPIDEGKVCVLKRQVFDFKIKPPDTAFLKTEKTTYFLKKANDGTSDLFKKVESNIPNMGGGVSNREFEKKICGGIKSLLLYISNRKPVTITKFSGLKPFKSLIAYEPYSLNGRGPYLVHVKAVFIRKGRKGKEERGAHQLETCFSVRGRLNGIHP